MEVHNTVRTIPGAAIHIASCAVAREELKFIRTRRNRANDDCQRSVAVDVGRNHTDFDLGRVPGHTLSRE